jgi:DtxR family Mn-dependent transcriptional regulator
MTLSNTVEDYLLSIYSMRADSEAVINARLAERLHVAPPTVTATLERMLRDGHIWINDQHQVFLTLSGERSAERLARRHRLIEHWLIRTLGLGWADVHEEADRLEHSVSEELTEHISASLGHPATCPHGLPIPGNYPETDVRKIVNLGKVDVGADARIVRLSEIAEDDGDLLHYLEDKQLVPGRIMHISEITPSGHLVVELDGATVVIDDKVASNLWVIEA